ALVPGPSDRGIDQRHDRLHRQRSRHEHVDEVPDLPVDGRDDPGEPSPVRVRQDPRLVPPSGPAPVSPVQVRCVADQRRRIVVLRDLPQRVRLTAERIDRPDRVRPGLGRRSEVPRERLDHPRVPRGRIGRRVTEQTLAELEVSRAREPEREGDAPLPHPFLEHPGVLDEAAVPPHPRAAEGGVAHRVDRLGEEAAFAPDLRRDEDRRAVRDQRAVRRVAEHDDRFARRASREFPPPLLRRQLPARIDRAVECEDVRLVAGPVAAKRHRRRQRREDLGHGSAHDSASRLQSIGSMGIGPSFSIRSSTPSSPPTFILGIASGESFSPLRPCRAVMATVYPHAPIRWRTTGSWSPYGYAKAETGLPSSRERIARERAPSRTTSAWDNVRSRGCVVVWEPNSTPSAWRRRISSHPRSGSSSPKARSQSFVPPTLSATRKTTAEKPYRLSSGQAWVAKSTYPSSKVMRTARPGIGLFCSSARRHSSTVALR